jgi:hypothetical protein
MPITGGILDLFCCLLLVLLLLFFLIGGMIVFIYNPVIIIISIIIGLFSSIGGINAYKRRSWRKALTGTILTPFIFLPFIFTNNPDDDVLFLTIYLATLFIGIVAIVLTILSRNQFERK